MEIRLLTSKSCNDLLELRHNKSGIAHYKTLDLHFDALHFIKTPSGIHIPDDLVLDPTTKADGPNSIKLHKAMTGIRPSEAADKRLWVSLTHDRFREYAFRRWIEARSNVTEGTIRDRFHFEGSGLATRMRNALSRLWWAAEMTINRKNDLAPYHYTNVLWSNQDLFAGLTERRFGIYPNVVRAILEIVEKHPEMNSDARRRWLSSLNAAGGVKSLPMLSDDEARRVVQTLAQREHII